MGLTAINEEKYLVLKIYVLICKLMEFWETKIIKYAIIITLRQ